MKFCEEQVNVCIGREFECKTEQRVGKKCLLAVLFFFSAFTSFTYVAGLQCMYTIYALGGFTETYETKQGEPQLFYFQVVLQ